MPSKPTLVFVPGSWHKPEVWHKLVFELEVYGFKSVAVALPTTLSDPERGYPDDVRAVRGAIEAETTQGRDVVVVVHSYGGAVAASALKGLTKLHYEGASSESGSVIGYFMISTGFTVTGLTFLDGFDGKPPPIWHMDPDTGFAAITVDPKELFYHDLPEEEGRHWVENLTKQSNRAFTEGADVSYAGWKDVPCWYLATTEDKALPIEAQRYYVQLAKDDGGDVTLREIATSHSPMLSKPHEVVEILLEAIAAFTK